MTSERIKEIQQQTAYPYSISVQQALLQVWNECSQFPKQETFVSKGSDECQFEPTTNTSSATICKHCGREKFLHKF